MAHFLDKMFSPDSVALIGASASEDPERGWLGRLLKAGYKGKLYPINPRVPEIHGLKAYASVKDIPGPVDYAIFNIPARISPQIMQECVEKGVKFAHLYVAGFSETGVDESKQLEKKVGEIARAGGVRVLGPNCMGVYNPTSGMTFWPDFPTQRGHIAFVSQSGAESIRLIYLCEDIGLYFSKVVSYGNALDLDAPDFLEYLADDEDTSAVACYIEGTKDGPRFVQAVKKCLAKKPVVILKAGLTESGAGAAASHTASMAGSKSIWEAFFRQTGALQSVTMDEVSDALQAIIRMKPPKSRKVAVVGRGGGIGVIASDICERAGLKVPPFRAETRQKLSQVIPEAGAGVRNPVETTVGLGGMADFYHRGLKMVDEDPEIDIILIHMAVDVYGKLTPNLPQKVIEAAEALCQEIGNINKPVAAALFSGGHPETVLAVMQARDTLIKAGIPTFNGVESSSRAISKYISYLERHRS